MAEKTFQLEILTPKQKIFEGEITSLIVPGALGYVGVLANHAPFITTLTPGEITYRDPSGGTTVLSSIGNGLLEVRHNHAILLADAIASK